MARWATKELAGWGRVCRASSQVARPERIAELGAAMADADGDTLIAHGARRSYGDVALNSGGHAIDTSRLDRLLEFDRGSGRLVAEAGVTFADLLAVFLPQGFLPPVVPGTGFATLGGAIANDIHGKNHHHIGSFGQQLDWFDLRLPNGDLKRVDGAAEPSLFKATVGGLGMTGIVERLCLRLQPVPSNAVRVRRRRVEDLDAHLAALAEEQDRSSYVVGWIDALARGRRLGRGILETASASPDGVPAATKTPRRVPFDFPDFALNAASVRLFNSVYYHRVPRAGIERLQSYPSFLFPLDSIHDWNRIYGKRGFHQFQCVLPFEAGGAALRQLLEVIAAARRGSFLAVLKTMGPQGLGYLSFARPGYTLALDFPNASGARELIARLERITCDHGGRTYLAKDSTLTAAMFREMYPRLPRFQAVLADVDPGARMQSDLARRLGIREAGH